MPSYILRTIDPALWVRVKQKAGSEGWPLRALLLALLVGYVDGRIILERASAESIDL